MTKRRYAVSMRLDYRTLNELTQNKILRRHWRVRTGLYAQAKTIGYYLGLAAINQAEDGFALPDGEVKIKLTVVVNDKRTRDQDNYTIAFKPFLDGLAKALDIDDSRFVISPVEFVYDPADPSARIEAEYFVDR